MDIEKLVLVLLFGFVFSNVNTDETASTPCTTFWNRPGDCVYVTKCPTILRIVEKDNNTKEELDYLQNVNCPGPVEGYVCCDDEFDERGIKLLNDTENFDTCGTFGDFKIIGGQEVEIHSRPWMALLKLRIGNSIEFGCAGTLINKRFVLTAAHCINPYDAELIQVRLGEHNRLITGYCNRKSCEKPFLDIDVEATKVHEDFNTILGHNDIALIKLARDVEFEEHIRPICLPLSHELREQGQTQQNFVVIGWGWKGKDEFVPFSDKLYRTNCSTPYPTMNSTNKLCASEHLNSYCNSDAGGALMYPCNYYGSQRFVQFGIINSGFDNCGSGKPAIYTNIVPFLPWISKNIWRKKNLKN